MPTTDHSKARSAVEIGRLWKLANRLLARIDQVSILFARKRERADTQHAVFRLQRHFDTLGDVVRDQSRNTNAKVHIISVAQFLRRAGGHVITGPAHREGSLSRTVRNSIFLL